MDGTARPATAGMQRAGYSQPVFGEIADFAHAIAGLTFPANRQPSAEAAIRRAMSTLRLADPRRLLDEAKHPGSVRETLLAELTVGESYFFRDEGQLRILTDRVLPAKSGSGTPLRVWSAGCASGEEAYTVAIMLREFGWTGGAAILGTDIATPRLAAAKRGTYTRWALRGVSEERIRRWFSTDGTRYRLDPGLQEDVGFRFLNLAVDTYPSPESTTCDIDLILCRNVMIYFDMPTVTRIATNLLASLAPDGWLVLGASDPPLAQLVPCEAVTTERGIAYRRADGKRTPRPEAVHGQVIVPQSDTTWTSPTATTWPSTQTAPRVLPPPAARPPQPQSQARAMLVTAPTARPQVQEVLDAYDRADYSRTELLAQAGIAAGLPPEEEQAVWVAWIRAVANEGRLGEAGELCARALETFSMSSELHYLHASLLMEAGWFRDTAVAARRAVYLDRNFVMAHLLLADSLAQAGDAPAATRALEHAIMLLERADVAAPVAAADGVPASRLRQIAQLRLQHLASVGARQ